MAYTPPVEFRNLLDRLLNNEPLSRSETGRFEEFLEDDQALTYYLQLTQQEGFMSEALQDQEPQVATPKGKLIQFPLKPIAWAAAACAIFSVGIFVGNQNGSKITNETTTQQSPSPAIVTNEAEVAKITDLPQKADLASRSFLPQITGMFGVRWAHEADNNRVIPPTNNRLELQSGIVELTYPNGVKVVLEGPASFTASGGNGATLDYGRLVASVPPGAEGFEVAYSHGKVVDLGTEFGMDVGKDGTTDVGVFDGEVEVHDSNSDTTDIRLVTENNALRHTKDGEDRIQNIPLNASKFIRHTPSRKFSWEVNNVGMQELQFDVSHLVRRSGTYHAVFKWMNGYDAIDIHSVSLLKDGVPIITNHSSGSTGGIHNTHDNLFKLNLLEEQYDPSKWSISATVSPKTRSLQDTNFDEKKPQSSGTLQLVEQIEKNTTKEAFIGSWQYIYNGRKFVRTFKPDHTIGFSIDNKGINMEQARWTIVGNEVLIKFPDLPTPERHLLLDANTLIFTNQPYLDAVKVDENQ